MKNLLISLGSLGIAILIIIAAPDKLVSYGPAYYLGFLSVFTPIALICISLLYMILYIIYVLQRAFPGMGRKQALIHACAFLSFFPGLVLFIQLHQGEYLNVAWYKHYYLTFPLVAYAMALLVILLHPVQSLKEIFSINADIE